MADNILTMPVVFIGHGSPTVILSDNCYTRAWRQLAENLPRPKAILVISAHWLTRGKTLVTAMQQPRTIHDFGRMDARLFEIEYPAPGFAYGAISMRSVLWQNAAYAVNCRS